MCPKSYTVCTKYTNVVTLGEIFLRLSFRGINTGIHCVSHVPGRSVGCQISPPIRVHLPKETQEQT